MKLLIMQFSPISCHFIPLRTKYSPQEPVLKHRQSDTGRLIRQTFNAVNASNTDLQLCDIEGIRVLRYEEAIRWNQDGLQY
jgi:hypothetical protein